MGDLAHFSSAKELSEFTDIPVDQLTPEWLTLVKRRPLQPWSWDDLENEPETSWQIGDEKHPVLIQDGLWLTFGPYKTGKTYFDLEQAFCQAFGLSFHGLPVKQCDVAYVIAEGGRKRHQKRFAALFEKHKQAMVASGYPDARAALNSGHFHLITSAVNLVDPKGRVGTDELIGELEPFLPLGIVYFDTWARMLAAGGTHSSSQEDVPLALNSCQRIRDKLRCSVHLVAHSGVSKDAKDRPMGMTDVAGFIDGATKTEKIGQGTNAWFVFTSVIQRHAEDGFQIFAQMAEYGPDVALADRTGVDFKTANYSGAQKVAMAELSRLGGSLVSDEQWRDACKAAGLWPDNPGSTARKNADAWRQKWKRLKKALLGAGAIDDANGAYSIQEGADSERVGSAAKDFANE